MARVLTPSILMGMHLLALLTIATIWNAVEPHPYMDEIFHIPQAQRYCKGDYWTWDQKLTTPPGLYVISNILLATQRPLCSTTLLRLTNLIYPCIILFTVAALLKELHPHLTRQERFRTAAVIVCFPILWFFNFLYYTDGGSAAFVLISWLAAKRRHHLVSAVTSAIAVTFRQTNIIWSLFILGTALLDLATTRERREFDPRAYFTESPLQLFNALGGFIRLLLSRPLTAITMALPNLGLLAGFAAFVKWNGGIVLGDKSNHVPVTHVVQLFYFAVFSAGMSAFAILGGVPLARLLKKPSSRSWMAIVSLAAIMAVCVNKFTYVHPFLLADNRHYTFYLCKLVLRNQIMRYALIPIYMISAYFCWQALGMSFTTAILGIFAKFQHETLAHSLFPPIVFDPLATEQTLLWVTIYATATALTLIPSPLIEFRYFITPYLIYRIAMRQSRGIWLALEFLLYTFVNVFTVWMFLNKPFRWSHEEGVQRFMW